MLVDVLINVQGHNTDFRDKHILYKQVYLSRYKKYGQNFLNYSFTFSENHCH